MTGHSVLKRALVGLPLPSSAIAAEKLTKRVALPIFAADALASTAFATEEILAVLVPHVGQAAMQYLVPISLVVVALLVIVVGSYLQTLYAYPQGGGSYIVSRENLGEGTSLVAAAALLVDYTLTVAVSVAAATAAITSAVEPLRSHRVGIGLVLIAALMLANLRGVRESGTLFAPPTYAYIVLMAAMVVWGLVQLSTGNLHPLPTDEEALRVEMGGAVAQAATFLLLLRAFSSGAVALSGIEAISNGIGVFKPPVSRNAAITLTWAAGILGSLFLGIAVLAHRLNPTLSEEETVLSQMGHAVFGNGVLYIALQAATAAILVLSANTAFAGFPQLSSQVAGDGFLPRQLAERGDRLVFSNGIIGLAIAAAALYVAFGGDTTALVPLFAIGLFMSFTLSQAGMVRHHLSLRETGWHWKASVNAVGAAATALTTVVVAVSKFTEGAWIPLVVIPVLVLLFRGIHRHYQSVRKALARPIGTPIPHPHQSVFVLVGADVNAGVVQALGFAASLRPDHTEAVHVSFDPDAAADLVRRWSEAGYDIPLRVLDSPYRELASPVLDLLDEVQAEQGGIVSVVIPEFVVRRWWEHLLHNQSALWLKWRLLFRDDTVVVSVPVLIDRDAGQVQPS